VIAPLDIERATIRAWPARITEMRFGWAFLAEGGVTGRVNAAWPIGWTGEVAVDDAIDAVEAWYSAHGLPPRFKLTGAAVAPDHLPDALARRGYAPTMHTLVMTMRLEAVTPFLPLKGGGREGVLRAHGVELSAAMAPAFDAVLVGSTPDPAELEERRSIALRAPKPATFAVLPIDGRAAAIGMSALADDLAGIFLMRTIPEARRQGCARRVLSALLGWAGAQGAANAFLQVEADNAAAVALYERAGFSALTSYRFWRKAP
jgi:GNAT superfamily N-acetyltransferase